MFKEMYVTLGDGLDVQKANGKEAYTSPLLDTVISV